MGSTVDAEISPRRKRRASTACLACRKSRIRCKVDPAEKRCLQCRNTGTDCIFDTRDGRKTRASSKAVVSELSKRIQHLESLLKQSEHGYPHWESPRELESIEKSAEIPQFMETDSDSQTTPLYDPELPAYPEPLQNYTQSSAHDDTAARGRAIIGKFIPRLVKFDMSSGRLRFFGPTTNMHVFSRSSTDTSKSTEFNWPISALINDFSPETHDYLIDLFFECHNSAVHIVHKWAFLEDLEQRGTKFYSNFLHMAMLAEGFRYADKKRPDIKRLASSSSPSDSSTFYAKAKKMAELELAKPGGIPSLQAFFLLGDLEVGAGRDDTGWMFAGMAFRLLFDIGLHVDPSELRLTEREAQIRYMVLWACIMNDIHWALYLGRPTMLKYSDMAPACLNKDFDRLIESQTPPHTMEKPVPTKIYEALLQLMDMLVPLSDTRKLRPGASTSSDVYLKITELDCKLNDWYASLPERLQWTEENVRSAPASLCLLHMQFHTALILLHRSFSTQLPHSETNPTAESKNFSTTSRRTCVSNAVKVAEIIVEYSRHHIIQRIFHTGLQHVGTAATALMAEISILQGQWNRGERMRLLAHLLDLQHTMQRMSEMHQPARLMATVVGHFIRESGDMREDGRGSLSNGLGCLPSDQEVMNEDLHTKQANLLAFSTPRTPSFDRSAALCRADGPHNQSSVPATPHAQTRGTGIVEATQVPPYSSFEMNDGFPSLPNSWLEEMTWEEDVEFLNLIGLKDLQAAAENEAGGGSLFVG